MTEPPELINFFIQVLDYLINFGVILFGLKHSRKILRSQQKKGSKEAHFMADTYRMR